jgi:hypothetical protein
VATTYSGRHNQLITYQSAPLSGTATGTSVNTNIAECTVPEKILLAAFELEEAGQSPFSAEALIVSAWQKFPRSFGLKGYDEQYPDSNKVLTSIMGEKGLARRGWLAKMGQKLYSLTRDGKQVVRRLLQGEEEQPAAPVAPVKFSKEQDKFLQGLLASSAYEKFQDDRQKELTFADACRYWGITENMQADILDARLDHFEATLSQIERQMGLAGATLGNGRSVSVDDTGLLAEIHTFLQQRFARHLTLLRNRTGR